MDHELTIIPGTRIALFRWSGSITFEGRMRNVERMAKFCRDNSIKQIIVDLRQQVSNADTTQMFDLGASVSIVMRGIQIAVVCQSSDRKTQFGESVAANRGAFSRSFTTLEEAQEWLEGKDVTPNKPDTGDV